MLAKFVIERFGIPRLKRFPYAVQFIFWYEEVGKPVENRTEIKTGTAYEDGKLSACTDRSNHLDRAL